MLHEFLALHRGEIIGRTRVKAATRSIPRASDAELALGIPLFFDQLIETLKGSAPRGDEMRTAATQQGNQMLRQGFSVGQVVYGYGDVCQSVTELALELKAPIEVEEFRILNCCLDKAVADAVTEYGRVRERSLADVGTERLGALAHELRNRVNTAMLSFSVLKNGTVAIGGSTGAVLERSLRGLADLIDVTMAEVRLDSTLHRSELIDVAGFVEEVEAAAILEARVGGHQLTVESPGFGVHILADRQLLGAAVANLVQNAFKFTEAGGRIQLRTQVFADRVFIDVEDECGGLPPGHVDSLFRPYQQLGADRSGIGLGLSISRKAVELNGGALRVRNLPGCGCVFTVDLPRALALQ